MFEFKDFENNVSQLLDILVENFNQMHAWYSGGNKIGTDNELLSQIFFYIVSSIDSKKALILDREKKYTGP